MITARDRRGRGDGEVGGLEDHVHRRRHLDDLAAHEAELLVVVEHSVHVLDPDRVHRAERRPSFFFVGACRRRNAEGNRDGVPSEGGHPSRSRKKGPRRACPLSEYDVRPGDVGRSPSAAPEMLRDKKKEDRRSGRRTTPTCGSVTGPSRTYGCGPK